MYKVKTTLKEEISSEESCEDLAAHCPELSRRGDCESNKATMEYYCPLSCGLC